jgi:ABC-type Fe3+-siderophore transport system permease subunit
VLHHFFGLTGITMTQAAADILTALVSIPFLFYFFRKLLNKKEALL